MQRNEDRFEVLLKGERSSMVSTWHEYLCLEVRSNVVRLSICGYELLANLSDFEVRDDDGDFVEYRVPDEIGGSKVEGVEDGEYVVGGALIPNDEVSLSNADEDAALDWLRRLEWDLQPGFDEAWAKIQAALKAMGPADDGVKATN